MVQNVRVGQPVSFFCSFYSQESILSWTINSTVYYWSRLPEDYEYSIDIVNRKYTLSIPEAKLWMNNTRYGCEYGVVNELMGCLHVLFRKNILYLSTMTFAKQNILTCSHYFLFNQHSNSVFVFYTFKLSELGSFQFIYCR